MPLINISFAAFTLKKGNHDPSDSELGEVITPIVTNFYQISRIQLVLTQNPH